MPKNIKPMNLPLFYINFVLFLIPLVQALLNKMARLSANFIIFLILFVLLLLPLLPLLSFGGKLLLPPFTPSIGVLLPLFIIKHLMVYCLLGSSPSYDLLRNKLQSCSRLCYFLGYGIGQKGYRCYDPISKHLRVLVMWSLGTTKCFTIYLIFLFPLFPLSILSLTFFLRNLPL